MAKSEAKRGDAIWQQAFIAATAAIAAGPMTAKAIRPESDGQREQRQRQIAASSAAAGEILADAMVEAIERRRKAGGE